MDIKKLSTQGFRTFVKKQEIDFSKFKEAGLYFVSGVNKVERQLGSNDAGKSSLFESMTFL